MNKFEPISSDGHQMSVAGGDRSHVCYLGRVDPMPGIGGGPVQ